MVWAQKKLPTRWEFPHTVSSSTLIGWNWRFAAVSWAPRTTSRIGDGIKWRIEQRLKSHAEATFYIKKQQQHSQAALATHNHAHTLRRAHWDPNVNQINFLNLDMHLNVLFIEYVAWLCVTSAGCKCRIACDSNSPHTLTQLLIQSPALEGSTNPISWIGCAT